MKWLWYFITGAFDLKFANEMSWLDSQQKLIDQGKYDEAVERAEQRWKERI